MDEYLLSKGEVRRELIEGALDGIGEPASYFDRVNLDDLRKRFLP